MRRCDQDGSPWTVARCRWLGPPPVPAGPLGQARAEPAPRRSADRIARAAHRPRLMATGVVRRLSGQGFRQLVMCTATAHKFLCPRRRIHPQPALLAVPRAPILRPAAHRGGAARSRGSPLCGRGRDAQRGQGACDRRGDPLGDRQVPPRSPAHSWWPHWLRRTSLGHRWSAGAFAVDLRIRVGVTLLAARLQPGLGQVAMAGGGR